jgi:hypothetical protein
MVRPQTVDNFAFAAPFAVKFRLADCVFVGAVPPPDGPPRDTAECHADAVRDSRDPAALDACPASRRSDPTVPTRLRDA